MSKNILQDIVRKNVKKPEIVQERIFSTEKEDSYFHNLDLKEKKNLSYNMLWFVAFISIIFLFFAISLLFFSAKVTINPKIKEFSLAKAMTATKNTNTDNLNYELVVLSDEESKEVQAGEEKDYSESAKGTVLIYNAFSSSPQPLSIDTRLEGSNGKIYKTKTKIIVPGSEGNLPGKIGVEIYAAEPGEEYNSTPIDFKILGFKNTPKYAKFYGRSVGEIKGGLKGKSRQVSESDKEKTIQEIKEALFLKLFQNVKNQVPKDFVLLKEATFLETNEANLNPIGEEGNFLIGVKATLTGVLFNKEKLTKEIINAVLTKENNPEAKILNFEDLKFSQPAGSGSLLINETKDLSFNLSGTVKLIWKIDEEGLVLDLLGKRKKDFNQILLQYPNIESTEIKIRPVWKNSFPSKTKDIKIIINSPS